MKYSNLVKASNFWPTPVEITMTVNGYEFALKSGLPSGVCKVWLPVAIFWDHFFTLHVARIRLTVIFSI